MSLGTIVGNIKLRNPLILASGVLGSSYSVLQRIYEAGIGAVVTKSVGPVSREGNPNPSVFALKDINGAINSIGLANPGYKHFREEIKILLENNVKTIVSIFGGDVEEFSEVLVGLSDLPITAFELNLSCPNTEKEGMVLGTDPQIVRRIVENLRKKTKSPIWVKLTPNVTDILEIADAAIKGGCDALVAINTLKAMVIDIYSRYPILGFKRGGLSGAPIKPVGIRNIFDLYEQFGDKIPLVGVGGIAKWEDVFEYILAGASAVQIGTALGVAHPENKIRHIKNNIQKFMKNEGIENIANIIGGAHR